MKFLRNIFRDRKGAALVEYALLVAGVALVTSAAVSLFGHKTNDMVSAVASVLPGAHADDNGPILSGHMIETAPDANGAIGIDISGTEGILAHNGTSRLGDNLGMTDLNQLVVEP